MWAQEFYKSYKRVSDWVDNLDIQDNIDGMNVVYSSIPERFINDIPKWLDESQLDVFLYRMGEEICSHYFILDWSGWNSEMWVYNLWLGSIIKFAWNNSIVFEKTKILESWEKVTSSKYFTPLWFIKQLDIILDHLEKKYK